MKSGRKLILAALSASTLLVAGCATETAYRPAVGHGFASEGYSDRQVEANRFVVTFSGNSYTSRDTVEKYLLYRAAELTLQHGDDYFIMANRGTDQQTRTYSTPEFGAYGGWGGYWGPSWRYYGRGFGWRSWDPFFGDPFWDRGVDIQTVQKYEATAEIIVGKGPKPADNVRAFDAHQVIDHIGPSVVLPK
ncbi:MAG: hypothetical protein M3R41_01835 [Pseudomonadota bacterium]|nr:hypothetical protein [Pseudomonadota bacterium]